MIAIPDYLVQQMNLTGRRALVTGSGGHIGKVVVKTLLDLGALVCATDYHRERLEGTEREFNIPGILADLTNETDAFCMPGEAGDILGGLDILIHCAALTGQGDGIRAGWARPLIYQSAEAFNYSLKVNLTAAFEMVKRAHVMLSASGHGSVILFGSIYGLVAPNKSLYAGTDMTAPVGYSAAKGGTVMLTKHLAVELSPRIRVNCITPGGLERGQPEEFQARYRERTPLGRMGTEQDMVGAVAFLASNMSAYVTGHNLVVDGGWSVW